VEETLVPGENHRPAANKSDRHDIIEILLKVALNTIKQTNNIFVYIVFINTYYR
jgi:hypothetical protein